MKLNNIIFPLIAASFLMTSCYDEKMDWHTPDGHGAAVSSEIPLSLAEEIANYDYIKKYMTQYMILFATCMTKKLQWMDRPRPQNNLLKR